ncbi:type II toxin-antitoxin system HipA family toxin [Paraburkholderia megapolitana]|uniref:Serine/threonine-protein kinase HipA n=1 Tax=Paraburkholderia megapolitana TaxID=420953 RepID=A0A1I3DI62_9BURK|nr:type II toxin-antitoxin system HipA family toxin [Paraburkholderia megapolitana]QDQ81851.1 type II toxin-antitoxin system HipA family toxin [Paraburkholderia megapolitana]SFH86259.1 serine/threonine-protein kinase HipA [Paraburkholderia megapolitana]
MADQVRPVWVWLPGHVAPVRCGTFEWSPGLGRFSYSEDYRKHDGALPLDPINLPFTRSQKPDTTTSMNGVFGVLRDAAPEGFGLDMLLARHAKETLDEVERMDLAPGDGVGAIEVCEDGQIERKVAFVPPTEDDLKIILAETEEGYSPRRVVRRLSGVDGSTSLGGEKPKLTVSREVDGATEWWIAKLQEREGAPHLPAREYVAMTLAARCGIDVAAVRYERVGPHEVVLVRRFDRKVTDAGVERTLFASAATVLRLRGDSTPEDPDRSYVKLAYELRRWCGDRTQGYVEQQRELWRRMTFNALVGNYDDHPRNHGLLCRAGTWTLSPAYDVVAIPRRREVQAMAVNRAGTRLATPESLVKDAASFSYGVVEAWDVLRGMAATVHTSWQQLFLDVGMDEATLESQRPAFQLAEQIVTGELSLDPSQFERPRRARAARSVAARSTDKA